MPTPSPLHDVDEGGLSRRYPVFLPSFAFTFVFAGLPPLVELLAAWAWTYGCVGCRDRLSLPVFSLFVFLFFCCWQLDRFFVDGYAVVCGFISNWFNGRVFFFPLSREVRTARGDGLRWWSVGFGFVEYIGINLLLENKIRFFVRSFGEKPNSFFLI